MWIKCQSGSLANLANATDIVIDESNPWKVACFFGSPKTKSLLATFSEQAKARDYMNLLFELLPKMPNAEELSC